MIKHNFFSIRASTTKVVYKTFITLLYIIIITYMESKLRDKKEYKKDLIFLQDKKRRLNYTLDHLTYKL